MSNQNQLILIERDNALLVQEQQGGALVTLMRVTAGAITAVQREYFRANIIGRIKQEEADLILKYFYDVDIR